MSLSNGTQVTLTARGVKIFNTFYEPWVGRKVTQDTVLEVIKPSEVGYWVAPLGESTDVGNDDSTWSMALSTLILVETGESNE